MNKIRVKCELRACVHFLGVKNGKPVCIAFKDGIPDEIAYGANEHTKPFKGDGGIQFGTRETAV